MSKGVESIRIKGQRIEDMPLGTGNEAKAGLPAAIETERLNSIALINARFPTQRIDYLNSRINECRENKQRMDRTIEQQNTMISDYNGHISMCKHRDKEIEKLIVSEFSQEEQDQKRKVLFKQYPPYNVEAMKQQIKQCMEAIIRCNNVKDQEDASIAEFSGVVALCKQRDKELAQYGAVAEG
jgi:chromosome segregation ATPase